MAMIWNDIIYVLLLLISIAFGPYYRKIEDPLLRQWTSTLFGLFLVLASSGTFAIHPLIVAVVNAILVTRLSPKICHLASLFFTFFYLLVVFRLGDWFGLPVPPPHTNLILMMLTVKLPGLAFEVNSASTALEDDPGGANSLAMRKVTFLDVFHYAFSYMGVLTGPYYRYRTYWDSLHRPFGKYFDPWPHTLYKLKQVVVIVVLFLIMNTLYPSKYAATEEFGDRSFLYRFAYMYPAFFTFRLRMYSGMVLSECACQMAGLGVYPTSVQNLPGLGPKHYKAVEAMSTDPNKVKQEDMDFETVHNMNIWEVEKTISVRTAMRKWNSCVQYWMGTCIYKRFPHKGLRTHATMLVSATWHGFAAGYYFCICQIPFFLVMEDLYMRFYNQSADGSLTKNMLGLLLWYTKTTCMAYLGLPFLLLDYRETLSYYRSVYCAGHFLTLILYLVGLSLKPYFKAKSDTANKEK